TLKEHISNTLNYNRVVSRDKGKGTCLLVNPVRGDPSGVQGRHSEEGPVSTVCRRSQRDGDVRCPRRPPCAPGWVQGLGTGCPAALHVPQGTQGQEARCPCRPPSPRTGCGGSALDSQPRSMSLGGRGGERPDARANRPAPRTGCGGS